MQELLTALFLCVDYDPENKTQIKSDRHSTENCRSLDLSEVMRTALQRYKEAMRIFR
jgi:hypothetical protein